MPGGVPPELAREREATAWRLRLENWTEVRIAEQLGVSQQAVSKILDRVGRRTLKRLDQQVVHARARQTLQLERLADEAMQAWERSRQDATTVKTTTGAPPAPGMPAPVEKVETTTKGQDGNPAYLAEVRAALADVRKLWGLDRAPEAAAVPRDLVVKLVAVLYPFVPPEQHGPMLEAVTGQLRQLEARPTAPDA